MNRRVLAALVALADIHEAKETQAAEGISLNDAYGRGGYVLHRLSEEDYELYESLAMQLCTEGKVVTDDPEAQALLHHARARSLPVLASEPLPPPPQRRWVCVVRLRGESRWRAVDCPALLDTEAKGLEELTSWQTEANRMGTGNEFDLAEVIFLGRKP
jgi:hypothetical protein